VAVAPGFIWLNFLSGLFLGGGRTTVNLGLTVPQPPPPTLLSQLICSATGCGGLKSPTDLAILGSPALPPRSLGCDSLETPGKAREGKGSGGGKFPTSGLWNNPRTDEHKALPSLDPPCSAGGSGFLEFRVGRRLSHKEQAVLPRGMH
jgi:hypothetical protein